MPMQTVNGPKPPSAPWIIEKATSAIAGFAIIDTRSKIFWGELITGFPKAGMYAEMLDIIFSPGVLEANNLCHAMIIANRYFNKHSFDVPL